MSKIHDEVTQARLKELLDYDPVSGIFTWRKTRARRAMKGMTAGYLADGYIKIGITETKGLRAVVTHERRAAPRGRGDQS